MKPNKPLRSGLVFSFKLSVALSLLAYVVYNTGLLNAQGRGDLLKALSTANMYWLFAAILYIPVIDFISALKWHYLAKQAKFTLSLFHLFVFYIVGRFFNLILPSSIGGDVIRVHLISKGTERRAKAAAVVFFERLTGLITLVFLALITFFIRFGVSGPLWLQLGLLLAVSGLSILCWLVFHPKLLNSLCQYLSQKSPLINKIPAIKSVMAKTTHIASKLQSEIQAFGQSKRLILNTFVYSLIFYCFAIGNVWVTMLVFQQSISPMALFLAVPIIMFIMNIPFSIGGIGIMEFAFVFVLGMFGFAPEVALSTALLMRIKSLIGAGFGAALYPLASSWGASIHDVEQLKLAE